MAHIQGSARGALKLERGLCRSEWGLVWSDEQDQDVEARVDGAMYQHEKERTPGFGVGNQPMSSPGLHLSHQVNGSEFGEEVEQSSEQVAVPEEGSGQLDQHSELDLYEGHEYYVWESDRIVTAPVFEEHTMSRAAGRH